MLTKSGSFRLHTLSWFSRARISFGTSFSRLLPLCFSLFVCVQQTGTTTILNESFWYFYFSSQTNANVNMCSSSNIFSEFTIFWQISPPINDSNVKCARQRNCRGSYIWNQVNYDVKKRRVCDNSSLLIQQNGINAMFQLIEINIYKSTLLWTLLIIYLKMNKCVKSLCSQ